MQRILLVTLLGLLATAPLAAATPTIIGPAVLTVAGTSSSCFVAATPIALFGPTPVLVLQNYAGWFNGPLSASLVAVQLTSGSISCAWNGSSFTVWSTFGTFGTAWAGP